jgi:hypothetical protein
MTFVSSLLDTNAQGLRIATILTDRALAKPQRGGGGSDNPADCVLVEPDGIEPTTSCLQSRRSPS